MSHTFSIPKDPYDWNTPIYSKSRITIKPGLTVLVGCNGSGKTTLLSLIRKHMRHDNIPLFEYNNLHEGGKIAMDWALQISGDMKILAALATSSEGEQIYINFGEMCEKLGGFMRKHSGAKERWILFDAIDSGLSIDNICELKGFLKDLVIGEDPENVYVIISANAYELCRGEQCFDVHNGKYVTFEDYEDYRDFVLRSRDWKDKRYVP